ncbi:MAG TPA: glycosyltransferase [Terriglobales bacterium]|nr:glycosyltransferase [Terriglobales bacterium]
MRICLVSTFPPSRGGLNEYGFHIAHELQQNPLLSVTILADQLPAPQPELDGFSVIRCWSFDDPLSPVKLLRSIREVNPDVVWFNLLFTTFGHNPLAAFLGLITPALARMAGYWTHITLHHLMDTIDLADAGVRFPRIYRLGGAVVTQMLLAANSVSVLMPAYRRLLRTRYGGSHTKLRAHGILCPIPEFPDYSQRGNPIHRVLAFGKWGTYKRVEHLIEAFRLLKTMVPNVKLIIAGGDHPRTPGYIASVAQQFQDDPTVEFTGYVSEEDIPSLYKQSTVLVLPYSSSAGASGVAHLASAYGVPIISADLRDFREMSEEEGMAIEFYELGNSHDLANRLATLIQSPEMQRRMAMQNFRVALHMTMPQVIFSYLHSFQVEQEMKNQESLVRLRRLPRWFPARAWIGRTIAKRGLIARASSPQLLRAGRSLALMDGEHGGSRPLDLAGVPANGNGVIGRITLNDGALLSTLAPAGAEQEPQ